MIQVEITSKEVLKFISNFVLSNYIDPNIEDEITFSASELLLDLYECEGKDLYIIPNLSELDSMWDDLAEALTKELGKTHIVKDGICEEGLIITIQKIKLPGRKILKIVETKEQLAKLFETKETFLFNFMPAYLAAIPKPTLPRYIVNVVINNNIYVVSLDEDFLSYNNIECEIKPVDPTNPENKKFVVLRGIEEGNIFWSMCNDASWDHSKLIDGTIAYHVIGFCSTEDETKELYQNSFGKYRTEKEDT